MTEDGRAAIAWGDEPLPAEWKQDAPCRDCGVEIGGFHHEFCCIELCPDCGGQMLLDECAVETVEQEA